MVKTQDVTLYDDDTGQNAKVESGTGKLQVNATLQDPTDPYKVGVTVDGRLKTDSLVTIEETFGFDNFADQWVQWFGGSAGDTIRYQIEGGASGDVTYVLVAEDSDRYILTRNLRNALNADALFKTRWIAKAFNELLFIVARIEAERGEAPNPGDVLITTTGTVSWQYEPDSGFQDRIIRRAKVALMTPDQNDNRFGVLGVQGEVSSVLKSENPIYRNAVKTLATANETFFSEITAPAQEIWYISQVIGASELDSKVVLYQVFIKNYVETFVYAGPYTLEYQAMPQTVRLPIILVNGVDQTASFLIYDDPNDETKSIIQWDGGGNINGDTVEITYDACQRVLTGFIQKPGSVVVPLETPLKLESGQSVVASLRNRSNNAGEGSVTLVGFFEEEL